MIVFDIDGTLSIVGDRLKHLRKDKPDWDSFYEACGEDDPNWPIVTLCESLARKHAIIYVTGRRESVRGITVKWLDDLGLPVCENLYMRKDGDFRHDTIVKPELIANMIEDSIYMVFEDRDSMVKKWRELGLTCLQVAEGDF